MGSELPPRFRVKVWEAAYIKRDVVGDGSALRSTMMNESKHTMLQRLLSWLVVVQCAGLAASVVRDTSPAGTVLFIHVGVGEFLTLLVDRGAAALCLAIALAAAFGRAQRGLVLVSAWFAVLASAQTYDGGVPFAGLSMLGDATRIMLPVAAFTVGRVSPTSWLQPEAFRWCLRAAIALTFAVHGYEAVAGHPRFVDFILTADRKLLGLDTHQANALDLMVVIGLIDIAIAASVLTGRDSRSILLYATAWGAVTAIARVVHMESTYPQTLLRVANGGLPLALLLAREALPSSGFGTPRSKQLAWLRPALATSGTVLMVMTVCYTFAASGEAGAADVNPRQLRLVWREKPSSEVVVAWSTSLSGSTHQVYFDTQSRGGQLSFYRFKTSSSQDGKYDASASFYHHTLLQGLTASTTYYFVAVSDGAASQEYHFVTGPADQREFKIMYGGDSRSNRTNRQRVNDMIRSRVESDAGILAFAHGGDYIEDGQSFTQWNEWLDDFQRTVTSDGRMLPLVPARGNHEASGPLFGQVFAFPGRNGDNYYVSAFSPQVAFIVLNSNASQAGDQRTFLREELTRHSKSSRWILASYHEPAYPAVKSPGGALEHWVPLFEEFNVDLVCESDGHVLKRTLPMRAGKPSSNGIVYVGEGGLGVDQRTPNSASYLAMARSAHHVQILTFRPDKILYQAVTLDGKVVDSYERLPVREGTATAAALTVARALSSSRLLISFNKPMDLDTALQADRYTLSPEGQVLGVQQEKDSASLLLSTSGLPPGRYTIAVDRVLDSDGLVVQSQASFVVGDSLNPGQGACPPGSSKSEPGQCGCDVPDTDVDGDGTPDCKESCPSGESCVPGSDGGIHPADGKPEPGASTIPGRSIGCSTSGPDTGSYGWGLLLLLPALLSRRRRSVRPPPRVAWSCGNLSLERL